MTAQIPKNHERIVDLLPTYLNGRLEDSAARLVREHLSSCAICQQELASWESIQGATRQVFAITPLPSARLMSDVWEKIDAPAEHAQVAAGRLAPARLLTRLWLVFRAQFPLLHKSLWIASPLVCLLWLILVLCMGPHTLAQKHLAGSLLVLMIVIVGASGSAFIYGAAVDPGFELTLATPTSVRLLMLCRIAIVFGYNFLLASLASAIFALIFGGSLWEIIQLWLGPLLFLSSLGLMISLFMGSTFALFCTAGLEVLHAFPDNLAQHLFDISLPALDLGTTNPLLLSAAFLLLVCAIFFVPGQSRQISLT